MNLPGYTTADAARTKRLGISAASAAYLAWGVLPGYFKWIDQVGPLEIIVHRVIWAIPVLVVFLLVRDGRALFSKLRIPARSVAWLSLSALLLSANWLIFVWAVVNDQVISTSLGYFITPLFNFLLGYLVLRETLTRSQKAAVTLAALGTLYLGWYLGATPWVALSLALLFAFYGLVRKRLGVGPMTGLMWENLLLFLPALAYLLWRSVQGQMDFLHQESSTDYFLMLVGLVTVLPLIWFNTAVRSLSLTVVGFFQYIAPSIMMLLAVFYWHEPFTQGHLVAFVCIWSGLALISAEQIRLRRRRWHRG